MSSRTTRVQTTNHLHLSHQCLKSNEELPSRAMSRFLAEEKVPQLAEKCIKLPGLYDTPRDNCQLRVMENCYEVCRLFFGYYLTEFGKEPKTQWSVSAPWLGRDAYSLTISFLSPSTTSFRPSR